MKIFNVCDYGAKICDRLQTKEFQDAIDACFLAGGGRVVVPAGFYIVAGIRLRSNVELYLEAGAFIRGSRDPEDYFAYREHTLEPVPIEVREDGRCASTDSTSRWSNGLVRAFDAENIAIIGEKGSFFDGASCYDPHGENNYRGPHGFSFWRCKNIRLEGYTIMHHANWSHAIFHSQNITVRNVSIIAGCDGLDFRVCDNILVENCTINSGDDCVAGFDNNDVIVRNCTLNTACMPLRFGGNNVLVENCVSDNRGFGTRHYLSTEEKERGVVTNEKCRHASHTAYAYYCDYRADPRKTPGNILIRNCRFLQESELMRLQFDGLHRWCCNRSLESITFENCTFRELTRTGSLWGDDEEKVTCTFKNCTISCKDGYGDKPLIAAANFDKLVFENCVIEGYDQPTVLVASNDQDKVNTTGSTPMAVRLATEKERYNAMIQGLASEDWAAIKEGREPWTDKKRNKKFDL